MNLRTKSILNASVRNFIDTARPITSEGLYERYDFGIKPAMIRWELNALSDKGFLYQNHPSGGRFPTDKAYRFLVSEILSDEVVSRRHLDYFRALATDFMKDSFQSFTEEISAYLKNLGVVYEPAEATVLRSGFDELCENLEIENKKDFLDVVKDFEMLPARLPEVTSLWRRENDWPKVFVGKSPLTRSPYLSVVAARFERGREDFFIIVIGPKRMDYEKSVGLLKFLGENA